MDPKIKISKSDAAYLALRKKITDFTLAPGQNISLKILSEELNFSQTPLREALFGLEKDGYVMKSRNESFFVTRLDQSYLKELFEYGMMLYEQSILANSSAVYYYNSMIAASAPEIGIHAVNPDLFYECAQIGADNQFVSKQLEIFRCRSASVRRAVQLADSQLYSCIYEQKFSSETIKSDTRIILRNIHVSKTASLNRIANAVLIYSANKGCHYNTNPTFSPEAR